MQINARQGVSEVKMIMWLSVWSKKGKEAQRFSSWRFHKSFLISDLTNVKALLGKRVAKSRRRKVFLLIFFPWSS